MDAVEFKSAEQAIDGGVRKMKRMIDTTQRDAEAHRNTLYRQMKDAPSVDLAVDMADASEAIADLRAAELALQDAERAMTAALYRVKLAMETVKN